MLENDKEITELIRKLIPINELADKIQNKVIANGELLELKRGKYLFRKGDRDHFSYYLLSGEIELVSDRQIHDTIKGGSERAMYAMAQLQPRQFSALAKTQVLILKVNRTVLDKLLLVSKESPDSKVDLSDTISGPGQLEVNELDDQEGVDWMSRMLQSELFMKIPSGNIQKLFALLESKDYKSGDTIIEQGQDGQHYYVIQEGSCIVTRKAGASSNPIKLAELKAGDSFGEESLLMDTKCNANVSMKTDGVLMKLSKENFIELIKKPTLQTVGYDKALELIKVGAEWLDVRFESEHSESNIKGSQNIPLNMLRTQIKKLSLDKQYIVYCDTGARSSAAAFLMTERGYKALYLDGGLISHHDISELITNQNSEEETDTSEPEINQSEVTEPSDVNEKVEPVATEPEQIQSQKTPEIETEESKSDSASQELEEMKRKFEAEMQRERASLQDKYTEAQRMLDKARLIRQDAEKFQQKLDDENSKRNSVVELSQQKVLKEMQGRLEQLESVKDKAESKNKILISKRIELETQLKQQTEEITRLTQEKESLLQRNEEMAETVKVALDEKQKTEIEAIKTKQEAKRIIEIYKEKHKQLYAKEEEILEHELQTLDENSSEIALDDQSDNSSNDNNLKELDMLKSKKVTLPIGQRTETKDNESMRSEMSEKLMQEISSQLGRK